ncbi:peptidase inhibitor family I36 protein [Streptomyces sp. S.PNR 29]|uniref:peptidase inhibitor family I36 protein n=1 Tax=Streptomyces sp. S.PNR 29 TaxID=2973805 RepID=UPI0025AEF4D0|nr:peptidase inhibitor family I36 protein [Streptomyces sp. S.PNR 29]MDN0199267.1 peptidase inhibitor family I36 protein [Streptomyces sp. S.PNR 29]
MRRIITSVLATGVLLLSGLTLAPTAQAAVTDCPDESGYFCFWTDVDYGGPMGKVSGNNPDWGDFTGGCNTTSRWDNCASSLRNEGLRCEVVVYQYTNYGGSSWVINRDTRAANLTQWAKPSGGTWNDAISSNDWWCGQA